MQIKSPADLLNIKILRNYKYQIIGLIILIILLLIIISALGYDAINKENVSITPTINKADNEVDEETLVQIFEDSINTFRDGDIEYRATSKPLGISLPYKIDFEFDSKTKGLVGTYIEAEDTTVIGERYKFENEKIYKFENEEFIETEIESNGGPIYYFNFAARAVSQKEVFDFESKKTIKTKENDPNGNNYYVGSLNPVFDQNISESFQDFENFYRVTTDSRAGCLEYINDHNTEAYCDFEKGGTVEYNWFFDENHKLLRYTWFFYDGGIEFNYN